MFFYTMYLPKISYKTDQETSECDSCPREEVVNRSRYRYGPVFLLSCRILNIYAVFNDLVEKMDNIQNRQRVSAERWHVFLFFSLFFFMLGQESRKSKRLIGKEGSY